jgi:hypothetical protein
MYNFQNSGGKIYMIKKISLFVLVLAIVGLVSAEAKIMSPFSTSPYPAAKTNINITSYIPATAGRNPDDTIRYDGGNYTGIGLTSGGTFWGATRFTTAYACTLKAATFFEYQAPSVAGKVILHDAGTTTTPGAVLDSAPYTITAGAWVRVNFTTPRYFASGADFWLDVRFTHAASAYPFGADTGPSVSPARSYVSTDGATWSSLPSVGLNYNWNLRAIGQYVRLANDVGVDAIVYPAASHHVNAPMVPIASVKNYGSATQTSFAVVCSITGPGGVFRYTNTQTVPSLASNATINVNFASWTPTILEAENVMMKTTLAGDQSPANDRKTGTVTIANFFLEEGFNGTWPPTGWQAVIVSGSYNWAQTSAGTNPTCTPYEGAAMAWYYSYLASVGYGARLISPAINFGTSAVQCSVAFYMFHDQGYPTDHDSVAVETSPDGTNWTFIGGVCRVDGGPANAWSRHAFYMGNLTGTIYLDIRSVPAFGDNTFIDYVTVSGGTPIPPPQKDVGMYAIRAPGLGTSINVPVAPIGVAKNFGAAAQSFAVICSITGGGTTRYTNTQNVTSLASGDTARVTFANYTPTVSEIESVIMRTTLANDTNPTNNRMSRVCAIYSYYQDFEATDGGFTADPSTGAWTWGTPTAGPMGANSGVKCWGTGTYLASSNWKLNSCRYQATANNPQIGFMHWYQIESGWDGGNIKYSTDGTNWTLISPTINPYNGLANTANVAIPGESCWTGTTTGNSWNPAAFVIPVNSGQYFWLRWHFGSDPSVQYAGWYVDDVVGAGFHQAGIEEANNNNVTLTALNAARPNPVTNGLAHISFTISAPTNASLKIYDASGRIIKTLVNSKLNLGVYNYTWNGTDDNNHAVAEGIYFYTLTTDNSNYTKKLVFTR